MYPSQFIGEFVYYIYLVNFNLTEEFTIITKLKQIYKLY